METTEDPAISICQAHADHLPAIVDLHLRSFRHFFLTFLGPRFLRLLYSEILKEPGHVAFVAERNGSSVVGFVFGVTDQTSLYRRLTRRRWFAFALASLPAAMRHPTVVSRLFRALRRPSISKKCLASTLLMSIAVAPDFAGSGIGRKLVSHFLDAMRARGVEAVMLETDKDNNEKVCTFYERLGFRLARHYVTPEGRRMNEYIILLAKPKLKVEPSALENPARDKSPISLLVLASFAFTYKAFLG